MRNLSVPKGPAFLYGTLPQPTVALYICFKGCLNSTKFELGEPWTLVFWVWFLFANCWPANFWSSLLNGSDETLLTYCRSCPREKTDVSIILDLINLSLMIEEHLRCLGDTKLSKLLKHWFIWKRKAIRFKVRPWCINWFQKASNFCTRIPFPKSDRVSTFGINQLTKELWNQPHNYQYINGCSSKMI